MYVIIGTIWVLRFFLGKFGGYRIGRHLECNGECEVERKREGVTRPDLISERGMGKDTTIKEKSIIAKRRFAELRDGSVLAA